MSLGANTTLEEATLAKNLFESIGTVEMVDETLMDAVTAVSGSGPAYLFLLAEAMIDGGVKAGLDRETADALVRQTLVGAAGLLSGDKRTATQLREAVTSKGGTTAAALSVMNECGVPQAIIDAVVAARDRGRELGA
jgi:pyrroline-5-carboxylate reductase